MSQTALAKTVAVVGASEKATRYSNRALKALLRHGFTPVPVSRTGKQVFGLTGYSSLTQIPDRIDTVTMYLSPGKQAPIIQDVLAVKPRRVIFNPGAENPQVYARLRRHHVEVVEACTLVLLSTGQF